MSNGQNSAPTELEDRGRPRSYDFVTVVRNLNLRAREVLPLFGERTFPLALAAVGTVFAAAAISFRLTYPKIFDTPEFVATVGFGGLLVVLGCVERIVVRPKPGSVSKILQDAVDGDTNGSSESRRRLGILAYGSLIDDPGPELGQHIVERIETQTPFRVEFARTSSTRGNAPTLIPVTRDGAKVRAVILVLDEQVTTQVARDMLYRREKHDYDFEVKYTPRDRPGPNDIVIEQLEQLGPVNTVLYTTIATNIPDLNATRLAELAIDSVPKATSGEDGVSYLIAAKRNGIITPLSSEYERQILHRVGTATLEDALYKVRAQ